MKNINFKINIGKYKNKNVFKKNMNKNYNTISIKLK